MWREKERGNEGMREGAKSNVPEQTCTRISCSGRLAPSPDAGSLPLLLMIIKLVCVDLGLSLNSPPRVTRRRRAPP